MAKPLPPKRNLQDVAAFVVAFESGDAVFSQGDTSRDLLILEEGSVELLTDDRVIGTLGPGDFFGEHAFFHGPPRELSARASTPCRLLRLDEATFEQLIGEAPEIGVLMLARSARERRGQPLSRGQEATPPPGAQPGGPGHLEVATTGRRLPLPDLPEIRIGRIDVRSGITPELDLTDLDPDKTVGRRHARLVRRDDRLFVVEDKATANGTFVNGARVAPAQETEVLDGSPVRFGMVDTVYRAG